MCKYTHKYYLRYIKNVARHYCALCDKWVVGAAKWQHIRSLRHQSLMKEAEQYNNVSAFF